MDSVNNAEAMRNYGKKMSLCMGIMMSLCLSAIGLLSANAFTPFAFLLNFAISFVIVSFVSHFFDAGMISMKVLRKKEIDPKSFRGRVLQALISDLIYSPIMTFVMVTIAYAMAARNGIKIPYILMLLKGMAVSFVAAFFLCLIFTPIFEKILMKKAMSEQ